MKYKWLNKKENKEIIIFFNGWGMNESIVQHLAYEEFDVLMFYDYNDLDSSFDFDFLKRYNKKHLVSWSMGVMVATLFDIDYCSKTAINGTLKPIDDRYGIPKRIYDLTIKSFSQKTAEQFIKNMFTESFDLPTINRTLENIKSELEALKKYSSNMNFEYTKVLLSSKDKIIPTKNQTAYWNIEPNLETGHAPFNSFKSWKELI